MTVLKKVRRRFLNTIIAISILVIFIQVGVDIFIIYPSFVKHATDSAENEAVRLAKHLAPDLRTAVKDSGKSMINQDLIHTIKAAETNFNLYKLKLFNLDGVTLYSTDKEDVNKIIESEYFNLVVTQGQVLTKTVKKDTKSREGQLVKADVVETYVPILEDDYIIGALEIYYNITEQRAKLTRQFWVSTSLLLGLSFFFLVIVIGVGRKMIGLQKSILEKEKIQVVLEMAGMVCHEINQPLMTISGYSEMILDEIKKDEDVYHKIKIIAEQTERISQITKKLMEITTYHSKGYLKGSIIDLEKASTKKSTTPRGMGL